MRIILHGSNPEPLVPALGLFSASLSPFTSCGHSRGKIIIPTSPAARARRRAPGRHALQPLRAIHAPLRSFYEGHERAICSGVHAGTGVPAYIAATVRSGRHGGHALKRVHGTQVLRALVSRVR